ncbi:vitamin B12 ABC transporter permease BtuC [Vibrio sp.]|uniref:vitamin B12 ABC transporter permease BtuC n=1 Tax=Vibrio sp. TaxID=678 RepID=UPI003D0F3967
MEFNQLLAVKQRHWQHYLLLLSAVSIIVAAVYLMVGEVWISLLPPYEPFEQQLVWQLRLPRLIAAMAIGASLALSGAVLQVLLGNVLAEPGVLGISGGASLMMVIVLFFLPALATPLGFMFSAIVGALLFTLILVGMARSLRLTTTRLLLVGVALGLISSAVVTWAFYFSDNLSLRQLMYWLMGSISGINWYQHWVTLVLLPIVIWLCWQGRKLDTLMLGEVHAKQLGLDVNRVRWRLILAVSVLIGGAVAIGGVIGFVGLVVPHLLRLALGANNRFLLPAATLTGAVLVMVADMIARLALDAGELPLGVVTTSIGAPIFIWMLVARHDSR